MVTLKSGDNYIQVMLGRHDMLGFNANGMNYYFTPVKDVLLLAIRGAKDEGQIKEIMEPGRMKYEILTDVTGKITIDDLILIVSVGGGEEAKKNRTELERILAELPPRGLTGRLAAPVYKGGELAFAFTDEIIVKFEPWVKLDWIKELATRYDLSIERGIHYLGNAYLLKSHAPADYGILDLIKKLQENKEVDYAQPNILQRLENFQYTPNDYLYSELPHLQLINCDDAWQTLGDQPGANVGGNPDITIGVLDLHGVDPTHQDLTGLLSDGTQKMVANFDFVNMNNQTQVNLPGDHGTQCAGSATARMDNNIGTVGVAPNCHLIGGRLPVLPTILEIGDIWVWMAGFPTSSTDPNFPPQLVKGADVISNSWGPSFMAPDQALGGIFDFLVTYGREGHGCILCFATGNYGYVLLDNRNPFAADEKTIAIGASINTNPTNPCDSTQADHNGNFNNLPAVVDTRSYFSPYGLTVDIVSPSHTCYDPALPPVRIRDPILAPVVTNAGDWPGTASIQTTLTHPANPGDTIIQVANSGGFQMGEIALLNGPGIVPNETKQINNIAPGRISIQALDNAYPTNTIVASGPNDYAKNAVVGFGGTSHSCPTVAGAAALMLSVKPNLSWTQVRDILRDTAVRIDPNQADFRGRWIDFDGDNVVDFSQWYGHGRLDVNAAVDVAIKMGEEGEVMDTLKEILWKRHRHTTAVIKGDRKSLVPLLRQTGLERVYTNFWPGAIAFDGTHIWVANSGFNNVNKIDINNNVVVARVAVGTQPEAIVFDGIYIWVANRYSDDISKIDAESNAVVATIGGFSKPIALAFDGSCIWVANETSREFSKISTTNDAVIGSVNIPVSPNYTQRGVAFDGKNVWVTTCMQNYQGRVYIVSTYQNFITSFKNVGRNPQDIVFDGTHMWVANSDDNTLSRIHVSNNEIETINNVGVAPHRIVFDGTHIWVSNKGSYNISKIDVDTCSVIKIIGVGYEPKGLAFDGTHIWVANTSQPYHGGVRDHFVTKIPAFPLGKELPTLLI